MILYTTPEKLAGQLANDLGIDIPYTGRRLGDVTSHYVRLLVNNSAATKLSED